MDNVVDMSTIQAFFWSMISIIGVVLMVVTYTYIVKLERIKCVCAEHPYRKFIKKYLVFAICFLVITAFIPPSLVIGSFGEIYAFIYMIIHWMYVIATIVFFIYALQYVRYLTQEKCKCSEDVRREVLYWWSIIELVVLSILVILPFLLIFINGALSLALVSGKSVMKNLDKNVMMATLNPVKGVSNASSALHKKMNNVRRTSSMLKKTF